MSRSQQPSGMCCSRRTSCFAWSSTGPALRRAWSRLFIRNLIQENRSILDLLGADYTFLNEKLASHYGIEGVTGPGFRRVTLPPGSHRGGLLTHGSILMLTSHTTKTSPVLRGKWIL